MAWRGKGHEGEGRGIEERGGAWRRGEGHEGEGRGMRERGGA